MTSTLTEFHFLRPLWLLMLVPLAFLIVSIWRNRDYANNWARACDPHLLAYLTKGSSKIKAGGVIRLLGIIWLLAVVALAGPAWQKLPQPVFRAAAARVILLDLSRSMDGSDVAPSRLQRAKFKALDMLKMADEGQTALVVFAGEAYVVSPLTDDADTIAAMIPTLSTELMPAQGSRPALAIEAGQRLLQQSHTKDGDIILVTDGLDDAGSTIQAAQAARAAGYRLSVIAVGSERGSPIPLPQGGFVRDAAGEMVLAQVPLEILRDIARIGNGVFSEIRLDDNDIAAILALADTRRTETGATRETLRQTNVWRDEGAWLLLAILPLAAFAFRRGYLAVVVLVPVLHSNDAMAVGWTDWWRNADQRGVAALEQGDAKQAATLFTNPSWRASALYRAGEYEKAASEFAKVDSANAHYNRGNALAQAGDYQGALEAYDKALALDPSDADIQHNRELIRKLLENQPATEQQQDGQANKSSDGSKQQQQNRQQSAASQENGGSQQTGANSTSRGDAADGTDDQSAAQQASRNQSANDERAQAAPSATRGQGGDEQKIEDTAQRAEASDKDNQQAAAANEPAQAATDTAAKEPPSQQAATDETDEGDSETQQAMAQWLRRVPDDPGGLLRRKFLREHQRQYNQNEPASNAW